jgi:hypothetical protein
MITLAAASSGSTLSLGTPSDLGPAPASELRSLSGAKSALSAGPRSVVSPTTLRSTPTSCSAISVADWKRSSGLSRVAFWRKR